MVRDWTFSFKDLKKDKYVPTYHSWFNIVLKVLANAVRQEIEIKGLEKRNRLSLFLEKMIAYIENSKSVKHTLTHSTELSL